VVLGDIMVDRFIWGSVSRVSPEAPVPIVRMERESSSLGGAGNAARNIVSLGGNATLVGLHGDDADGDRLAVLCREAGLSLAGLVRAPGRPTTVKTRIVAHHQHVVRFDREEDGPADDGSAATLRDRTLAALEGAQALIVSDYDKGALSPSLLQAALPEARRRGIPAVVDPKVRMMPFYRPATVVTPNVKEASESAGIKVRTDADLIAAGRRLLELLECPHLLITRGEKGMLLLSIDAEPLEVPTEAREVYDVSGAGDTVAATLALALAVGATVAEGVILANLAAGVVVGKLGTASLTAEELLRAARADQAGSVRA
jgi:D-beta-D-heptose 7-phosphate kinase/D-beta-D-heptose 1-phosphate adenosyltransferase